MILTQVSPVAHASQDNDPLPEIAGHIAYFTDDVSSGKAYGLVRERGEEQRPQSLHIIRRERGDDAREDERWQRHVHRHLRRASCGGLGEEVHPRQHITRDDRKEPAELQSAMNMTETTARTSL